MSYAGKTTGKAVAYRDRFGAGSVDYKLIYFHASTISDQMVQIELLNNLLLVVSIISSGCLNMSQVMHVIVQG